MGKTCSTGGKLLFVTRAESAERPGVNENCLIKIKDENYTELHFKIRFLKQSKHTVHQPDNTTGK